MELKRFKNFLLESDNYTKSISGLGKFGMLDKSKFPEPLEDFLKNKGWSKYTSKESPYGGSEVKDQIYGIDFNEVNNDHMSMTVFINKDKHYLVLNIYVERSKFDTYFNIEWEDYNKIINFINDFDIVKYSFIGDLDDLDEVNNNLFEIANQYGFEFGKCERIKAI